jgi:RNA polymerase sigma-70 factor (ECF subfamily)
VAPATSPPLLPLVASGDRQAIRACIERYGGLVWSLARRARLSGDEAEDVVQDIFVALWTNADRFDPRIASEATFVAMIARRRIIDSRRRKQRRPETEMIDSQRATSTLPPPELGAEAAQAARAIDQLRPEQKLVLLLTACQGLSHEEVAERTGMPLGTVKAHARRGLLRLREVLGAGSTGAPGAYAGSER